PRLFSAVPVDDLFSTAEPLHGPRGVDLERTLQPTEDEGLSAGVARRVRSTRTLRGSVESMVGTDAAILRDVDRHLLRATSVDLDDGGREAELAAAASAVERFRASISTQARFTITLTAREGTVPLTIRNDSGLPVEVEVRLRSPKLELP